MRPFCVAICSAKLSFFQSAFLVCFTLSFHNFKSMLFGHDHLSFLIFIILYSSEISPRVQNNTTSGKIKKYYFGIRIWFVGKIYTPEITSFYTPKYGIKRLEWLTFDLHYFLLFFRKADDSLRNQAGKDELWFQSKICQPPWKGRMHSKTRRTAGVLIIF